MNTSPETRDCRADFKPTAEAYRKKNVPLMIIGWLALLFWAAFAFVPRHRTTGLIGFMACWVILFVGALVTQTKLICPACRKDADGSKGGFCPECGVERMKAMGFWDVFQQCRACGKKLVHGRGGRRYKIRYCRQCGAYLDSDGV